MSISFGLGGVQGLLRKLSILSQVPSKSVRTDVVLNGALLIAEEAKRLVPVKSGTLRDSITVSLSEQGGASVSLRSHGITANIGPSHPEGWYGHLVEFGTVNSRAHPFMRPAFDAQRKEAERAIADGIRAEIRRVAGN